MGMAYSSGSPGVSQNSTAITTGNAQAPRLSRSTPWTPASVTVHGDSNSQGNETASAPEPTCAVLRDNSDEPPARRTSSASPSVHSAAAPTNAAASRSECIPRTLARDD